MNDTLAGFYNVWGRRAASSYLETSNNDLGKTTFDLVALGAAGKVLLRKKFTQKQL